MGKKQFQVNLIVFYPFIFSKRSFVGKDKVNPIVVTEKSERNIHLLEIISLKFLFLNPT
jgi:hypothetical protein